MPHRIDQQKITANNTARTAVKAALVRLNQIETATTLTNAQAVTAIKDLAGYMKHIIKVIT